MMNKIQKLSALAVGSLAVILLLGTNLAQAEEDVCVDGDTVTGIKGLQFVTDQFGRVEVDVNFRYTTGFDVYGQDLDGFPFTIYKDEDARIALEAINNTLNLNAGSIPDFAGLSGINAFYVGVDKEAGLFEGLIAAWGGANYQRDTEYWEPCEEEGIDLCILGAALLDASETKTYADLTLADGSTCDGGPPPTGFNIVPGISGSWFDFERSGEGFSIEIIRIAGELRLLTYFYTYDADGNQMWLTGNAPVNGDSAIVSMLVTSGPVFGPAFDPLDVSFQEWGTITFTFSSCNAGKAEYDSINFGSGTFNLGRATYIADLACP